LVTQNQTYHDFNLEYDESGGSFELPPEANYKIVFKGVVKAEDRPKTTYGTNDPVLDDDGNPVMETTLLLQFAIDDEEDDYDGVEFRDFFPLKITPGNKSGRLWAAFLGITVEELMANPIPKTSAIVGRRCDASLGHSTSKSTGKTYLKIGAATPLKKKRERPAPVQQAPDADPGF
jgi:hypothetical protein